MSVPVKFSVMTMTEKIDYFQRQCAEWKLKTKWHLANAVQELDMNKPDQAKCEIEMTLYCVKQLIQTENMFAHVVSLMLRDWTSKN